MFKDVTLEISLKPFKQTDDAYIRNVCKSVFGQWMPLCKDCETVSVMFWTSDGSEILDYNKNLDDEFEWCKFIGTANRPAATAEDEANGISTHQRKRPYIKNPPKMTYRILKRILEIFREEAALALPRARILLGETFDLGPEFAISEFKYSRHPEICSGTKLDSFGFLDCTARLNADDRPYAAYPNGIPKDLPFALFFGKQADIFLKDMGFDYIWLSNGMGFSANPWALNGKVYDKQNFYPDKLTVIRREIYNFWRLFREGCPDIPVRVRGTNNSVGIDYATDGVPLYDIYRGGFNISSIPNSPWAALNDNYGLELMGHMTRISELPQDEFMFRFYLHDPWWHNSPWYDRYDCSTGDIYMPMAISRIDRDGKAQAAATLQLLSIDNSFGNMPDCCANEVIPHLLKAKKDQPDEPAPLVWVYPLKEYTTATEEKWLREMYFGDNYIKDAINRGLPLNCVVSSENFLRHDPNVYAKSILISPVHPNSEVNERLSAYARQGKKVIFYGSRAMLDTLDAENIKTLDIASSPDESFRPLAEFGIELVFDCEEGCIKPPTMTVHRSDNAMFFSVYNCNTTTKAKLRMPLGAPILSGGETKLENGFATYHFARGEHRECRVFVKQDEGVISLHEATPHIPSLRRRIRLSGLNNATVCFFGEKYCEKHMFFALNYIADRNIKFDKVTFTLVEDAEHGCYYKAEGVSGMVDFMMPFPDAIGQTK